MAWGLHRKWIMYPQLTLDDGKLPSSHLPEFLHYSHISSSSSSYRSDRTCDCSGSHSPSWGTLPESRGTADGRESFHLTFAYRFCEGDFSVWSLHVVTKVFLIFSPFYGELKLNLSLCVCVGCSSIKICLAECLLRLRQYHCTIGLDLGFWKSEKGHNIWLLISGSSIYKVMWWFQSLFLLLLSLILLLLDCVQIWV